ncbi:hypothetical protein TrCOL_g2635 [Triparma columacea]|uniref:Fatty acid desaturase domain-containing protein n=1 Tax=Triparma columacea TaxID=722753 RepID=A0A9W7GGB8_9STRA|nr:hypothetical protein TrCOL_g2635 [Triparma columacea]
MDPDIFKVSTMESTKYFLFDLFLILSTTLPLYYLTQSQLYQSLPPPLILLLPIPLQLASGFSLWCMWCIGHDAGHGTFSKSSRLTNEIIGEISHSMLCLTPFAPWRRSHARHHLNHNHLTDDYSHQWFVREEDPLTSGPWWMRPAYETRNLQLPFLYFVYLFAGVPDGGHVIPYGKMWSSSTPKDVARGLTSSAVTVGFAGALLANMGTTTFATVVLCPWLVMSSWLFTVTYLQHHSDGMKLYTDDTWTFTRGGFETCDRDYGEVVNTLSHDMMNGHVMHHLFFAQVPHYKLRKGTEELKTFLEKEGMMGIYKSVKTENFLGEILKQFDENWFFVNEKDVVR